MGNLLTPECVILLWRRSVSVPSLRCSSFPCLILWGHTVCNLRVKGERCVTAGSVARRHLCPCCNHSSFCGRTYFFCSEMHYSKSFLCKTEFCAYWYSQYFRGIGIFLLAFLFFSFLFPVGEDFSVFQISFLIVGLITPVFCGAFYFNTLRLYFLIFA